MQSIFLTVAAMIIVGSVGLAVAEENADDLTDFTQRNPDTQWYVCHTDNHRNDRFVNNIADRDFCHDVANGTVLLTEGGETGDHIAFSKIICNQRNVLCLAAE